MSKTTTNAPSIYLTALVAMLLLPAAAYGLHIDVFGGIISDNQPGDTNAAAGVIEFDVGGIGPGFFAVASGRLSEVITPGSFISLVLTDFVVQNLLPLGGANLVDQIDFFSSLSLPPLKPVVIGTAHLDGEYFGSFSPPTIAAESDDGLVVDLGMAGFLGQVVVEGGGSKPIGPFLKPPPVDDQPSPFSFGPNLDVVQPFFEDVFSLHGTLIFTLGSGDGIFLPTSARVVATAVPQPSTLLLIACGLILLGAVVGSRQD
jgi:hypothetical protein